MSFDLSRYPFNPWNDYLGVVMQQGRVQLDSDWNEWQAEFGRRLQAGTLDIVGRAAYPETTPSAFKISVSTSGTGLTIGAGRMYVDGLLAENHGVLPAAFAVTASDGLADPGTYGIQITAGASAGQFNLSLYQVGAGAPAQVGTTLANETLATLQADVAADPTLPAYIQIQAVASTGRPSASAVGVFFMLAPIGADYGVSIPAATSMTWDPALAELSAAPAVPGAPEVDIDYTQQPYLPGAAAPGAGPYLAYLDVWRRPITYLENPALVDAAVGVDTTGRIQTVWQVKLIDLSQDSPPGGAVTCSTPDADIPAYAELLLPPGGNLTTGVVQSAPDGPCALTPNTGYTGMENQLYRVEIHQGGVPLTSVVLPVGAIADGVATFKWSRENASVATAVSAIASVTNAAGTSVGQLTVQTLGRDDVLGFNNGDWIEITDDYLELNSPAGVPTGELHQIDTVSAPDKTITLMDALASPASFPLQGGQTDASRHTRIRRWDQSGKVYLSDGATLFYDGSSAASGGAIPVPPAGTTLVLENGVTVAFGIGDVGQFRCGDFWNFAGRAADGTVEVLTQAPPLGIHHHYARLAVVTFGDPVQDCRTPWPPASGCECGCTVTVGPADLSGDHTLQKVIDVYRGKSTNVVICLLPGTYTLAVPIVLEAGFDGLTIEACQSGTAVLQAAAQSKGLFHEGMIVAVGAKNLTFNGLTLTMPAVPWVPATFGGLKLGNLGADMAAVARSLVVSIGIRLVDCGDVTIKGCVFTYFDFATAYPVSQSPASPLAVGVFANGILAGLEMSECLFKGRGDFSAGFLHVPTVALGGATAVTGQPVYVEGMDLNQGKFAELTAKAPAVKPQVAKKAQVAKKGQTAQLLEQASGEIKLGNYAGQLDGAKTAATLASRGGQVLPAELGGGILRDNEFAGLTVAVLVIAEVGLLELVDNIVATGGGFWVLAPQQALTLLQDTTRVAMIGPAVAMSLPLPAAVLSTGVSVPASTAAVRIYAGSTTVTDAAGNTWNPDTSLPNLVTESGGHLYTPGTLPAITDEEGDTEATPALYQSERAGIFSYTFTNLAAGFYTLTLKFAEIFYTNGATNQNARSFNVSINGEEVLDDFNVVQDAGGANVADDQVFRNLTPNDQNQIVVSFTAGDDGNDNNAKVGAVSLEAQWDGTTALTIPSTEWASYFLQVAQVAAEGYYPDGVGPSILQVRDNILEQMTSTALLVLGTDDVVNDNISSLMLQGNQVSCRRRDTDQGVPTVFLSAVAVGQVSQCVVTGNSIANLNSSYDSYSLMLDASAVSTPGVIVASNLFDGCIDVLPPRYPDGGVQGVAGTWEFLNTVINCDRGARYGYFDRSDVLVKTNP